MYSLFHGSWLPVGYAGWVENVVDSTRFDGIDTNRFPCCRFVIPEVDLRDATLCKSSRDVTCESCRIVKCPWRIDSVWVYWTCLAENLISARCLPFVFSKVIATRMGKYITARVLAKINSPLGCSQMFRKDHSIPLMINYILKVNF